MPAENPPPHLLSDNDPLAPLEAEVSSAKLDKPRAIEIAKLLMRNATSESDRTRRGVLESLLESACKILITLLEDELWNVDFKSPEEAETFRVRLPGQLQQQLGDDLFGKCYYQYKGGVRFYMRISEIIGRMRMHEESLGLFNLVKDVTAEVKAADDEIIK